MMTRKDADRRTLLTATRLSSPFHHGPHMHTQITRRHLGPRAAMVALMALVACSDAAEPPPFQERAVVCEPGATTSTELPVARLGDLVARGGYVARLLVDRDITPTPGVVFRRITDALKQARESRSLTASRGSACRIVIQVSPGTYVGTTGTPAGPDIEQLPLLIDIPNVTLRGAYDMPVDAAGRASGPSAGLRASVLRADPPLRIFGPTNNTRYAEVLVAVDAGGDRNGHNARIEGFVFQSGHQTPDTVAGVGVLSLRAEGIEVIGNSFEGNFSERVDVRSGGVRVERNYSSGPGGTCDICMNGPGTNFIVRSNTLVDGGVPGVLIMPFTLLPLPPGFQQLVVPRTSTATVVVDNNDVSGHQRVPVGTAYRVAAIGNGAPDVQGTVNVSLTRNLSTDNRFGLIIEGGFPVAGTTLRGDVNVSASGNTFINSCQANLLISLSRHSTGLGLGVLPYLRSSTFALSLGAELPFADAWFSHPAALGNTLRVDGADMPNGTRAPYNAAKVCL